MIRLGSLAGYSFKGPRLLTGWTPPERPAVYAILYKPDPDNKQDTYAVVYVDHSDDMSQEGLPFKHPRSPCWIERAGSRWKLYIAFYEFSGGGRSHREMMAQELIAIYDPACNLQKYDKAWKKEWIGAYQAETTRPLAPRGPDERPL